MEKQVVPGAGIQTQLWKQPEQESLRSGLVGKRLGGPPNGDLSISSMVRSLAGKGMWPKQ